MPTGRILRPVRLDQAVSARTDFSASTSTTGTAVSLTSSEHPGTKYKCLRSLLGHKYLFFGLPPSRSGWSRRRRAVTR